MGLCLNINVGTVLVQICFIETLLSLYILPLLFAAHSFLHASLCTMANTANAGGVLVRKLFSTTTPVAKWLDDGNLIIR